MKTIEKVCEEVIADQIRCFQVYLFGSFVYQSSHESSDWGGDGGCFHTESGEPLPDAYMKAEGNDSNNEFYGNWEKVVLHAV